MRQRLELLYGSGLLISIIIILIVGRTGHRSLPLGGVDTRSVAGVLFELRGLGFIFRGASPCRVTLANLTIN